MLYERITLLKRAIAGLLLACALTLGGQTALADSRERLFLQVSSHDLLPEAIARARGFARDFPQTAVFESVNGKLAVVVGTAPRRDARVLLSSLKLERRVPQDSLMTGGARYARKVWVSSRTGPAPGHIARQLPEAAPRQVPQHAAADVVARAKSGGAPALTALSGPGPEKAQIAAEAAARRPDAPLSARCSMISVLTAANGGYSTDVAREDSDFILMEQFCLARLFAIAAAEELVRAQWGGFGPEVARTCDALTAAMAGVLTGLDRVNMTAISRSAEGVVHSAAAAPGDLIGTGKVCLGAGYAANRSDTVLAAAVLLHALGEQSYGEYVGHHLLQGVGVRENPALAAGWLASGTQATGRGAGAGFTHTAGERAALISAALTLRLGN